MSAIKITAPLEPVPFKRALSNGRRRFNDPRYVEFKEAVGLFARRAMNGTEPLKGAIKISVTVTRNLKPSSRNFGDADNHLKAVLDALNGICYVDDAQVVQAEVTLLRGAACVQIELEGYVGTLTFNSGNTMEHQRLIKKLDVVADLIQDAYGNLVVSCYNEGLDVDDDLDKLDIAATQINLLIDELKKEAKHAD